MKRINIKKLQNTIDNIHKKIINIIKLPLITSKEVNLLNKLMVQKYKLRNLIEKKLIISSKKKYKKNIKHKTKKYNIK